MESENVFSNGRNRGGSFARSANKACRKPSTGGGSIEYAIEKWLKENRQWYDAKKVTGCLATTKKKSKNQKLCP